MTPSRATTAPAPRAGIPEEVTAASDAPVSEVDAPAVARAPGPVAEDSYDRARAGPGVTNSASRTHVHATPPRAARIGRNERISEPFL